MTRRLFILALTMALAACATGPRLALWRRPSTPRPAEGLWAILDPGCRKPSLVDIGAWPKCASPFWISRGAAVVVRTRPGPGGTALDHSYRAEVSMAGDNPVIAEVGNSNDGHLYLALTRLARDDQGRLIGASGAAFACPGKTAGPISLAPNATGCESATREDVRRAATATLRDQGALTEVAWIAAGAP
ncbi:MAG: hypothetical protein ABI306_08185 [Caulobacteraceae bacterium]